MEEFQESEVLWPDHHHHHHHRQTIACSYSSSFQSLSSKKNILCPLSVPLRIPEKQRSCRLWAANKEEDEELDGDELVEDQEEEEEKEAKDEERNMKKKKKKKIMIPPHVMTSQKSRVDSEKMMAFCVCTGNGRTLKGRDLSQARNSILRMTGFLEATCSAAHSFTHRHHPIHFQISNE